MSRPHTPLQLEFAVRHRSALSDAMVAIQHPCWQAIDGFTAVAKWRSLAHSEFQRRYQAMPYVKQVKLIAGHVILGIRYLDRAT